MMRLPVLFHREKAKRLVTMTGITKAQQDELFDMVLHIGSQNDLRRLKALCAQYEKRGARFVYEK